MAPNSATTRSSSDSNALLRRTIRAEFAAGDNSTDKRLSRVFRRDDFATRLARLNQVFASWDPVNGAGHMREHKVLTARRSANDAEIRFALRHLYCGIDLVELGSRALDARVNALVAFMLVWDSKTVESLSREPFNESILAAQLRGIMDANEAYVTATSDGGCAPFCKKAFKVVRICLENHRERSLRDSRSDVDLCGTSGGDFAGFFSLASVLRVAFVEHLRSVYLCVTCGTNRRAVEAQMSSWHFDAPYDLASLGIGSDSHSNSSANLGVLRYVTGVACAGKSTLLDKFGALGWRLVSRRDVGSFAGKASDPTQVAGMHAALEWVLGHHDNVLGDRGPVDNPLWRGIMSLGGRAQSDDLPMRFVEFFDGWINAPVIAYFRAQRVVVFVDTRPQDCQRRMLRRACDGDLHRGRIDEYPLLQTIGYYAIARIMGWPVVLVPYNESSGEFEPRAYDAQFERMCEYFGPPGTLRPLPRDSYARPQQRCSIDASEDEFVWAKSVGIYK